MYKGLVQLPEAKYLGYGIMMPWENNLEMQFDLWREVVPSKKSKMLQKLCGGEQLIGIFCYRCDTKANTFSYHIACENKRNALGNEFEELKIYTGTYARFENVCENSADRLRCYNDLCDEIWGQWLPNSEYISLIELETMGCVEGYASLEVYHPDTPMTIPYRLEILLPVKNI